MAREDLAAGIRSGIGLGAATFVLGLTFGAEASAAGWSTAATVFFSAFGFSGSAQFTLLATLSEGTVLAAIAAAAMINARYVVMSVALNNSLEGNRWRRALHAMTLTDASFVIAHAGGGRYVAGRLIGATLPQWITWVAGTAVGVLLAPSTSVMHTLGLDVVFPAFFLLLAIDEVSRSRRALAASLLGATVAGLLLLVTNPGYALLGATVGALLGVRKEQEADG